MSSITNALIRAALAASLVIAATSASRADIEVDKYKSAMESICKSWGSSAASLKSDAARKEKIKAANLALGTSVRAYNFPDNMKEDDVLSALSKLRTCVDKAAKDAFGSSVSVVIKEQTAHNLKKGAPRLLDLAVDVNW